MAITHSPSSIDIATLCLAVRGSVLAPGDDGWDEARTPWNVAFEQHPALVVVPADSADVQAVVLFAVANGLRLAPQGTGHGCASLGDLSDAVLVRMTELRDVEIDAEARRARAGAGALWEDVVTPAAEHGLVALHGSSPDVGVTGYTLGGGVGWLMGRCGLSCDNTLAYDVVTANGELVTASPDSHPDLFWALKGGGGNFGVVTSITYRLHPVSTVISGMLLYPLATAREVMRNYRDFVSAGLPDELIVYAASITTPDGVPMLAIVPSFTGADLDEGERLLAPLRAFGPPAADLVARMPYVAMQQMLDAAAPYGLRSYWKSHFLRALPDEAIDTFVGFAERCTSPRTFVVLEHGHGAVARVAPEATAFPIRGHAFDLVIIGVWADAADDARNVDWTRAFHDAMQPWSAEQVYVNALSEDDAARIPEAYGGNFARLASLKATYDPDNRFRHNQNIAPAHDGRSAGQPHYVIPAERGDVASSTRG